MSVVSMRELLEAGVHFGHQANRWNPKMAPFIYSVRNDIHVIDLHKTIPYIEEAYEYVRKLAKDNKNILFIGTKKQAQEAIESEANKCGMPYVNQRWMGGTLTNFKTLKKNIIRLKKIEEMENTGIFEKLPKKEVANLKREHTKLMRGLGGIREMADLPGAVFIVDTKKEIIAVKEARKLGIPIVGILDTNCDPAEVDHPIPGNDDAIRSIKLICSIVANAVLEGREIKPADVGIEGEAIAVPAEIPEELEAAQAISEEERLIEQEGIKLKEFITSEDERTGF
ncbi:MAG: 30S ribosomal protein S2 [Candidatus Margulisbacteria bacterium]|nr:30S ribosomal protein S2 [Candidatus Margulisiibacteriota bacterium]MBU1022328.1 30S ribosomal protein S2 [Candidatus Margulisiibacteriota bacterium]MBU1729578.1 30S ribosomal protein S2 [Candidatus Margulisiibacteriota bacterium]MBU1955064.1 30S ribosomal protein S2 [Candidatus Margulisiibacteriota bacterium]